MGGPAQPSLASRWSMGRPIDEWGVLTYGSEQMAPTRDTGEKTQQRKYRTENMGEKTRERKQGREQLKVNQHHPCNIREA